MSFVHLHVHSEFSLLDGLSRIPALVQRARELEMPALALTDHGAMFGVVDFYHAAHKAGIKPIIGMEAYLAPNGMRDRDPGRDGRAFHLLLLAENDTGYRNLLAIATASQLEGFYYRPRIDHDYLAAHAAGLICTTGCLSGEVPRALIEGREQTARSRLDWYFQVFGREQFFIELQHHELPELPAVNRQLLELGAHYGAEKLGCTVIPISGGMTERQVQIIQDFKPDIIMVTPSYMLAIAEEMEKQGIDPKTASLRIGIFGAEPWTPAMRDAIEAKTSLDAIDIYGLSEIIGPGVAQECIETKDGLTVWEDHFYPEVIDPDTGEVLPEGEKGELVFTSLTKEALPMIRYRTRDLTRLLPPTARSMRRMEKITGRSDDMLIIRGVNLFPTQVEELILKQPELTPYYMLEVTRPENLDELTVHVEMGSELANGSHEARHAAVQKLEHNIKAYIGISAEVALASPMGLERSIGKAKRIIDRRPKQ